MDCCRVVATVVGSDEIRMEAPRNSTNPHVINDGARAGGPLTLTTSLVVLVKSHVFSLGIIYMPSIDSVTTLSVWNQVGSVFAA